MAFSWLKIEKRTPDKPHIAQIAEALGITTEEAFGRCFKVWRWFDDHTVNGNAKGVSIKTIDECAGLNGFAKKMEKTVPTPWLVISDAGIKLPHFNEHTGVTAKKRALALNRARKCRAKTVTQSALPEKSKSIYKISPPIVPPKVQAIYDAYPKHVGKQKAFDAIAKALKKVEFDLLLERTRAYADSVAHKRGTPEWKFVPHPSTWFNQGRWEDELEKPTQPAGRVPARPGKYAGR